jgi:outer membrane protein
MNTYFKSSIFALLLVGLAIKESPAQDNLFSLEECISYALENSTTMGRAGNQVESQSSYLEQAKAERGPNLMMSGSESLSSRNSYLATNPGDGWERENSSYLDLGLSSSLSLYNGAKLKNAVQQGRTNLLAAESDIQTQEELISLEVLSAYIYVLYYKEQVKNSESQMKVTEKQLEQATARREAGILSPSDFLNMKSQYASDRANLIASQSDLRIGLVSLMQLMNMPASSAFDIVDPDIESLLIQETETDASVVYNVALGLQPGLKTAELDLESADLDIKLAKADALPVLSLTGGFNTYSSTQSGISLGEQISRQINPSLGLALSIPIYQRKKVKNNVMQAEIQYENYQYKLVDIKNDLRKAIEQACTDALTTQSLFDSNSEQLEAEQESYRLAEEMFAQGLVNSVDYLTSKNNLTAAENKLSQSKYNMVLQNRIVNYYLGDPIKL